MPPIRVLVVDDHAILRDGIRSLLERQSDIAVVGEASNGLESLHCVARLQPDIVLMDLSMPVMGGLEATRLLKEAYPYIQVLILTQHDSREYIAPLLEVGAAGYILKRSGSKEVVGAIRQVHEKGTYFEPGVVRQAQGGPDGAGRLTSREHEILKQVIKGRSNKEIARALAISPKTVSVHRTNIMSKLGVQNSADLVRYAMQHHLVEMN